MTADPPARRFYVSVVDGPRYGLLLGPFDLHQEALDRVEEVRRVCADLQPWSHFYGFGTASLLVADAPPGRLNDHPRLAHLTGCADG